MILIPISLALLALTAGMFLLAKTRKESLGTFFKVISYFIIIVSFLIMLLTLIGGFTRMLMRRMHQVENSECMMNKHNREPWMEGRFSHHEGMERKNGWNRMNKMEDGDERDMENYHHDSWTDRKEWEIKKLTEKLKLTSEQISKVQEIFNKNIQEIEIQRNQKMEAIKKILTPEQLNIFNENKEGGKIY